MHTATRAAAAAVAATLVALVALSAMTDAAAPSAAASTATGAVAPPAAARAAASTVTEAVAPPPAAASAAVSNVTEVVAPPAAVSVTSLHRGSSSGSSSPASFSLAISPTRLVVGPSDTNRTQTVQVINGGTAPMPVVVQKQNFTSDSSGALILQKAAPYSASTWVRVAPTSFMVPAGGTVLVKVRITVPPSPEPGDHQLSLVFLVPVGHTSDNVRINRGIAMPVFITVPGAIDDTASVSSLHASWFSMGGSVDVGATVQDTGTVHRDFRNPTPLLLQGSGSAKPFPDFTVMRGGTRDISTTWNAPLMCICHLTVSVTNAHGLVQSKTVRVIVFPVVQVLIALLGLIVLAGLYRLGRRHYRTSVVAAAAALSHMGAAEH